MKTTSWISGRKASVAVGVVTLCTTLLTTPAMAAASKPAGASAAGISVSEQISAATADATLAYWTPQRMATAISLDVAPTAEAQSSVTATDATRGAAASYAPAAGTLQVAATPELMHASSVARPYTNLPDRLNGKVFFTLNGTRYVCSGTVVNSDNKDMVDTAGHCVSDGAGHFATSWMFVPAYSSAATGCTTVAGCYPYGRWTARTLATRSEWHNFSNLKQDLGYGVLATLSGRHIVNYLGGQGSTFNQSRTQTWNAYGYPQAAPFNGFDQKVCTSGRLADDNPSPARPGPLTIRIHCNMTGGSSGGGWIIRLATNGLGYVNSHVSYGYSNQPDRLYGPYFGNEALALFNFAKTL